MALVNGIDDEDDEEEASNKFTLFPHTVHGGPPGGAPGRCAPCQPPQIHRELCPRADPGAEVPDLVTPLCGIVILNRM